MAGGVEAGGVSEDGFGGGEIGGGEEFFGEAKAGEDGGVLKDGDAVGGESDFLIEAGAAGGVGAGGGAGEDVADTEGGEDLALGEEGFATDAAEVKAGKRLITQHPHGGVVVSDAEAVHHTEERVGLEEGEIEGEDAVGLGIEALFKEEGDFGAALGSVEIGGVGIVVDGTADGADIEEKDSGEEPAGGAEIEAGRGGGEGEDGIEKGGMGPDGADGAPGFGLGAGEGGGDPDG